VLAWKQRRARKSEERRGRCWERACEGDRALLRDGGSDREREEQMQQVGLEQRGGSGNASRPTCAALGKPNPPATSAFHSIAPYLRSRKYQGQIRTDWMLRNHGLQAKSFAAQRINSLASWFPCPNIIPKHTSSAAPAPHAMLFCTVQVAAPAPRSGSMKVVTVQGKEVLMGAADDHGNRERSGTR
jgi:hypothetical protein